MRKSFCLPVLLFSACLLAPTLSAQSDAKPQDKGGRDETRRAVIKGEEETPVKPQDEAEKCTAVVLLAAVLHVSGEVRDIKVLTFTPEDLPEKDKDSLTKKASAAAARIKFEPARKNGRPASQRVKLQYCFNVY